MPLLRSPDPGNNENDENAFEVPATMKAKYLGEYTLIQECNPEQGTEDFAVGHVSITADDITGYWEMPERSPLFGTYESLKEFYELARKADPDSVNIVGDSNMRALFTISNATYEFQYYNSDIEEDFQLIIRDGMTGEAAPYKLQ